MRNVVLRSTVVLLGNEQLAHDNDTEKPAGGPSPSQAPLGLRTTPLFFRQVLITHFFLGPVLRADTTYCKDTAVYTH